MGKEILIGEIESGPDMIIRVRICEFRKRWYLDIRKFVTGDGEPRPTPKGIMMHQETAEDVFPLIEDGRSRLVEKVA